MVRSVMPASSSALLIAVPAAPAPTTMTRRAAKSRPVSREALISPAITTAALPC